MKPIYGKGLQWLAIATAVTISAALVLVFFYAPLEADQGFVQKIFYLHVPLAIMALVGFVIGGIFGIQYLRTGNRAYDLKSYVAIHLSLVLALGVLITGSIWARASWGHWWLWDEPMLVSFLIIFLLYACYQPLRFAVEDPERQARYAAVFAVVAGAFVPMNFAAVRQVQNLTHPKVLGTASGGMPGQMWLTFVVALVGMALLWVTLWRFEITVKNATFTLKALQRKLNNEEDVEEEAIVPSRRAATPQVPLPAE